jgi:heme-degrading monooxygenase HmoA
MRTRPAGVVLHVMLIECTSEHYDKIARDTSADAHRLGAKIDGLQGIDLYGTDDRTHFLLLSRWVDDAAWGRAQWNHDVQNAVVARFTSAHVVHSRLYRRIAVEDESEPS